MFFEDFTMDFEFQTSSRKISKKEILNFALEWDPQSFHIDEVAAQQSPYGGIIASGWQTLL
ncbi:MAG: MaoC/PaaZ C-terminal domain-containing protein, partial [Paracoccaceae bacterium]|nr:MaoC/PaaZ C-terminal domain-containing protein [Paracoccaceae bacterium]